MRFFSSLVKSSKEKTITTRNHHTGQMETTAILLIHTHTWGINFGVVHSVDTAYVYFTLKKILRTGGWSSGTVMARCSLRYREPSIVTQFVQPWVQQPKPMPQCPQKASSACSWVAARVSKESGSPHNSAEMRQVQSQAGKSVLSSGSG